MIKILIKLVHFLLDKFIKFNFILVGPRCDDTCCRRRTVCHRSVSWWDVSSCSPLCLGSRWYIPGVDHTGRWLWNRRGRRCPSARCKSWQWKCCERKVSRSDQLADRPQQRSTRLPADRPSRCKSWSRASGLDRSVSGVRSLTSPTLKAGVRSYASVGNLTDSKQSTM